MLYLQGQENSREEVGLVQCRRRKHVKHIDNYNHLKQYNSFYKHESQDIRQVQSGKCSDTLLLIHKITHKITI